MNRHQTRAVLVALVLISGCTWPATPHSKILALGEPCTEKSRCREPLACIAGTCEPTGEAALGESCVLSGDCEPGLRCVASFCATAGSGGNGAACRDTAACQQNLYCAFEGLGGTCRPSGRTDVNGRCPAAGDCAGGLVCDAVSQTCSVSHSPPFGQSCQRDLDCSTAHGLYCQLDAAEPTCLGRGPDGQPIANWEGTPNCAATSELDGDFQVLFDLAGSRAGSGFYRLPFPNDARRSAGSIDLTGHPTPPPAAVPSDLFARYLEYTEKQKTDGFGPNQTVFLRLSGPPKYCLQGCADSGGCELGCMGPGEPERSLYVADLTKDGSGEFKNSPFNGINYRWISSTGRNHYICWNWVAFIPGQTAPWKPGHTYFAFVHTRVQGRNSESLGPAPDFVTMLQNTAPGDSRDQAWQAHAPLREWLVTEPPFYPVCRDLCADHSECSGDDQCVGGICGQNRCARKCGGDTVCAGDTCEKSCLDDNDCDGFGSCLANFCVRDAFCDTCPSGRVCTGSRDKVTAEQIAGGALFTIRDPTTELAQLAAVVATAPAPVVANMTACLDAGAGADCSDGSQANQHFVEVQGDIVVPVYQEGRAPYELSGGAIARDEVSGLPVRQSELWVRFSLTLPKSEPAAAPPLVMPAAGWPVVIYVHGAGGDHRSHIRGGLAESLSRASTTVPDPPGMASLLGFAMLGIEQVAHGSRAAGSAMQPELLFFNFANAEAARGNSLQGAADQLALLRGIANLSASLAGIDGLLAALGLNPTTDTVALDPDRVALYGHSQGARLGALAMQPKEASVPLLVFAGAGANYLDLWDHKVAPFAFKDIVQTVIADSYEDPHAHPAVSLMQGYLEEVDPGNFARGVSREPPAGGIAKHLLQVIGTADTDTPETSQMIFAARADVSFIDDDATGLPDDLFVTTPPVRENRTDLTRVATIHQPAVGEDGHRVVFDINDVAARVAEFFASWSTDPEQIPTVR